MTRAYDPKYLKIIEEEGEEAYVEALRADGVYEFFSDPWVTPFKAVSDEASAPWFRAIYFIDEYEDDRYFRELIKTGVKPPEEMHEHIDAIFERLFFPQGKRKKFKVETKRGPKKLPKLWTKTPTEVRLVFDLLRTKYEAAKQDLKPEAYLTNQLKDATDEKYDHLMKLINLHNGRRGSAKKGG